MSLARLLRAVLARVIQAAGHGRWGYYPAVLGVILWANYIFHEYRVLGSTLFAILPVVATVLLYLWLILLLDELVEVLGILGPVARALTILRRGSLFVVGLFGGLAALLWLNGQIGGPIVRRSAQVVAGASANLGFVRYAWWTVQSGGPGGPVERILWRPKDTGYVYVGGEVELVLRRGPLFLWRVLEVRPDDEAHYRKMLEAAPASRVALAGLVTLYAERRDFEQAIDAYAALTRVYPHEPEVGYQLGTALVDGRRYRQAVEVFRQVLAVRRDYETLYILGYALAWAGEKREAATYLREATALDPEDYRALYSLGYVLRDTGRYAEAKVAWSKVLELMPEFPEVEQNLRAIERRLQQHP